MAQDVWAQTFKYMADQKVLSVVQHEFMACYTCLPSRHIIQRLNESYAVKSINILQKSSASRLCNDIWINVILT